MPPAINTSLIDLRDLLDLLRRHPLPTPFRLALLSDRPRFRTKSFISLPLKNQERLVGVLNLADKRDDSRFTESDLNLVPSFANQAVLMIDRTVLYDPSLAKHPSPHLRLTEGH